MSEPLPPYTVSFDLVSLSERGAELSLSPDSAERTRIAGWLDALEVPRLQATVRLARGTDDTYRYDAEFEAEVVQACVVTLEPVRAVHTGTVSRRYRISTRGSRRGSKAMVPAEQGRNNEDEVLTGSSLDVAAPVLEELSLVLDPYPRAPGVTFEPPKDESKAADNPFAVLAKLKSTTPRKSGGRR
jgi:uncharacterized metal-binding protein YceD (DUF177 family)